MRLALAEFAEKVIVENGGRVSIMGLVSSTPVPASPGSVSMAFILKVDHDTTEIGRSMKVRFTLVDPDGKPALSVDGRLADTIRQYIVPDPKGPVLTPSWITVLSYDDISLAVGQYEMRIFVNGKLAATRPHVVYLSGGS